MSLRKAIVRSIKHHSTSENTKDIAIKVSAAVVSFNEKAAISHVFKTLTNKNQSAAGLAGVAKVGTAVGPVAAAGPAGLAEVVERKREKERAQKRKSSLEHPAKKIKKVAVSKQNDYGPASSDPDMSECDLEIAKKEFLKNLATLTADRDGIERNTILQRDSSEWLEIRKNLITASNFGPVCKRQVSKDTAPLVKNILYKSNISHVVSIAHGIENEQQALQKIEQQENVSIEPCGLFIDKDFPFIGATPDGLIGNDVLVEVKCPFAASKIGLTKAIEENKIQILKYNKKTRTTTINKRSNWFFQVQGLHVTGRRQCLFGIWAGEKEPVHIERIEKDDEFWKSNMESKLSHFYHKCLLPEIINPRHTRGMPIRNLTLDCEPTESENKENESFLSQNIINLQPCPISSPTGQCSEDLDYNLNKDPNATLGWDEPGSSTRTLNYNEF
ncbi:hypothetical protein ABMA28_003299 [Loxostege sticticalis]|uniref:YqaJ viral recombinase domain-containing protein n=1 Tax=Loxostege sticticalis TaxID=481309 RepID=A0ABD0SVN4_LOXSC